ncbi:glycosyltransferase [Paenibacillus spongiae]|uniref:Glycosyltransferase n=1 Tax=Paenibacillus spongiae TaxID=2909671 RepID=A0ABY5S3Y1_9BACL|nr:glycosyltransferase [Paenibacillus spongiae]UVI28611.1 glycosyltransferase [Paenibacillus spongiae]
MALRKKLRSVKSRKRPAVRLSAFQQGRITGFQRGREDGFAQGRANAAKKSATAVAVPEHPAAEVLVITAGFIPSLEIGVIQPLSALKNRENLRFDVKQEDQVSHEMIEAADTVIFVRNVEPAAYALLELAKRLGKRTVYVIDDNFLEIQPTTAVGQYYSDPVLRETFIKFLRNVHIVKVDAQELGAYIQERFNRNVVYFPASVDFEWLDEQSRRVKDDEQIVIGYEGGAKEEDFVPVTAALSKILDYYGGFVRLEFFGYVPASLADHPSVRFEEGGMEYKDFLKKLNRCNWDIGLAPLGDNTFNKGKTNNKLREYGACRIPGIYSNSPVYAPWVNQGETGYLVPHTEKGWFEGIKDMIENPAMRIRIRENAEAAARQHFSLTTCIENWKKFIFKL